LFGYFRFPFMSVLTTSALALKILISGQFEEVTSGFYQLSHATLYGNRFWGDVSVSHPRTPGASDMALTYRFFSGMRYHSIRRRFCQAAGEKNHEGIANVCPPASRRRRRLSPAGEALMPAIPSSPQAARSIQRQISRLLFMVSVTMTEYSSRITPFFI